MPADFCAIPSRAMADDRLTAAHHRLLQAIAWHDRFSESRNSGGCYALQRTLAKETRIHHTNIPRLVDDLAECGYIRAGRHPENRRRLVYRVIYGDDATIVGESTNFRPAPQSPGSQKPGDSTNFAQQIVGRASGQEIDSKRKSVSQYIPLNGIIKDSLPRDSAKQERDLAEAPASNGCELRRPMQWGEQLARLERLTRQPRETASDILSVGYEAGYGDYFEDSATSDERILEILHDLKDRGSPNP